MKLLKLANRYYLVALIFVFMVEGLTSYFILKHIIDREFNRKLQAEKEQLVYELHAYEDLKDVYYLNIGDKIELSEYVEDPNVETVLLDTMMYDPYEKMVLPFRKLIFTEKLHGKFYVVSISKSLLPNLDLIQGIGGILLITTLILIASLIWVNTTISRQVWTPFYTTLDKLKKFNLTKPSHIELPKSGITEFEELRAVLQGMMQKTLNDYQNLKEYTENTTHEIQTPLAIIKSKAEVMLQENLSVDLMKDVVIISDAASRLARLKDGLSTLSKIDNNQFTDTTTFHVKDYIIRQMDLFEELLELKNINVTTTYHGDPVLIINTTLAQILFTNLINNAIKHNVESGQIDIILKDSELTIANTGLDLEFSPEAAFGRFKKSGKRLESTGLGLSMVKSIVDLYAMGIQYSYSDHWHKINLTF